MHGLDTVHFTVMKDNHLEPLSMLRNIGGNNKIAQNKTHICSFAYSLDLLMGEANHHLLL